MGCKIALTKRGPRFPRGFHEKLNAKTNNQRHLVGVTFQLHWEALLALRQPASKELDWELSKCFSKDTKKSCQELLYRCPCPSLTVTLRWLHEETMQCAIQTAKARCSKVLTTLIFPWPEGSRGYIDTFITIQDWSLSKQPFICFSL